MPQFDSTTFATQIFWLLVCFTLLCLVMRFLVVPRLMAALEAREQRIQENWNQSQTFTDETEVLRQENLEHLAQARATAHSMMHQVLDEIHHRKANRLAILDGEITIKTKQIHEDLETQTQKILANIEPMVSQVVRATSVRILGTPLSQAATKRNVLNILKKRENP